MAQPWLKIGCNQIVNTLTPQPLSNSRQILLVLMLTFMFSVLSTAQAQDIIPGYSDYAWKFQVSLHTQHFDPEDHHVDHQKLINLEMQKPDGRVRGLALFDNSFGQFSQYVYMGKIYQLGKIHPRVYAKVTYGLLHGYKGEFEDKIPFNNFGVAPAIIPMLGYQGERFNTELLLLGNSATMLVLGYRF